MKKLIISYFGLLKRFTSGLNLNGRKKSGLQTHNLNLNFHYRTKSIGSAKSPDFWGQK